MCADWWLRECWEDIQFLLKYWPTFLLWLSNSNLEYVSSVRLCVSSLQGQAFCKQYLLHILKIKSPYIRWAGRLRLCVVSLALLPNNYVLMIARFELCLHKHLGSWLRKMSSEVLLGKLIFLEVIWSNFRGLRV